MTKEDRNLARALRDLPQHSPPKHVWESLRRRAEAEGLISRRRQRIRRDMEWLAAGALAATVVLTLLDFSVLESEKTAPEALDESRFAATPVNNGDSLGGLMRRSASLEQALRSAPPAPRVMRASTAGTIAALEDRIAVIDQQLSFPGRALSEEEARALWRERVQLMNSLVELRYARSRRVIL